MPPPESNPFRALLDRRRAAGAAEPAAPVDENPFRALLASRKPAKGGKGVGKDTMTANYVAREIGARRILDNLMAVPDASGELLSTALSGAAAGIETAARIGANNARSLVGTDRVKGPTIGERFERHQENPSVAQRALRAIPRPSVETVSSALESVPSLMPGGETPSDAMLRNRLEFRAEDAKMRREHPVAATVGDVGGDVLSLVIGRRSSGAKNLVQRVETRLAGKASVGAAETLATDLGKVLKGPGMQRLARGGVRSLESGVEAAALDLLKDPNADPIETAALAAGSQLVGSGALATAVGLVSGGKVQAGLKLSLAAIGTAGILQVLKSSTPGGRDRVLESVESGYDKVALALGLGVASAAIGATRYGRGNTNLAEQSRAFLDGIATVHRGTLLSVLTDWNDGDDKQRTAIENVLTGLAEDPTGFKPADDAERAIVRRLRDGAEMKAETSYRTGGGF